MLGLDAGVVLYRVLTQIKKKKSLPKWGPKKSGAELSMCHIQKAEFFWLDYSKA